MCSMKSFSVGIMLWQFSVFESSLHFSGKTKGLQIPNAFAKHDGERLISMFYSSRKAKSFTLQM